MAQMNRNFAGNIGQPGAPGAGIDHLLTDREAASILDCGRSTLWRWAAGGTIPKPLKIGGMSRWRQSDIEAVIAKAEARLDVA
jgi:predicted DNA-binding transcriptional regulator AlpA